MVVSRKERLSYIGKNIQFLRKKAGKTLEEMAELLALKGKSSFKAYEEERALPDIHKLMRLASFFDVSLENLVYKDISALKTESQEAPEYYEVERIPVKIAAGYARGFGDSEFISGLDKIKIPYRPYGIARAFEINGDSMEPEIKNGSTIIGIQLSNAEIKDNKNYIVVTVDGPQCKKIRFSDNDTIYLISKNEKYAPKHISKSDVLELWEVWKII